MLFILTLVRVARLLLMARLRVRTSQAYRDMRGVGLLAARRGSSWQPALQSFRVLERDERRRSII